LEIEPLAGSADLYVRYRSSYELTTAERTPNVVSA
jgi:hypothetical protein